jgi:hypothetical protein
MANNENEPKPAKTLTGARAVVSINTSVVGLFESCTYGVNIATEPIHLLGKFGPDEIVPTSYEAVTINCTGFRVVGNGVHMLPKMPKLDDLLTLGPVSISIKDRQTQKLIMNAIGCVPTSYSTGVNARATSRIQITYVGLKVTDESGDQVEADGSTGLP